jgi:hypothetical protein
MPFRPSKLIAKSLIPVLAGALASLAHAQPIKWTKMIWEAGDLGPRTEPHAALLLEVKLDSQPAPARMQLDTGASGNILYMSKTAPLDPAHMFITLNGTVAGRPMQGEPFIKMPLQEPSGDPPLIGTIGVSFFEGRVLLMDFAAQQVAILDKDEPLPDMIAQGLDFVSVEYRHGYRNGKVFVPVSLNGAEFRNLFFDTGAAVTGIATVRDIWSELTGRQPLDPANERAGGESWGKQKTAIGAPLKGEMCVGKACFAHPMVYFDPSGPDRGPELPGVIGIAPFDYHYSLVLDLAHQRLGLCKGSIAALARDK